MKSQKCYQKYMMWLLLAVCLPVIHPIRRWMGSTLYILPIYWGTIVAVMFFLIPRVCVPGQLYLRGTIISFAASGAIAFFALKFVVGATLKQLATSPYDTSASGIFFNAIAIFPALVAREMIRVYFMGTIWRSPRFRIAKLMFITIFMGVTELNYARIMMLDETKAVFIYLASDFIPVFTQNVLMSMLAFYGGASAGIVYLGLLETFQKCFPFLPELPWLADSAIGIVFPVLYAQFIKEHCQTITGSRTVHSEKGTIGYLATLFCAVAFSWFCVGVFNIYPSVVLTGSMEPVIYPGDVVLIHKILKEEDIYLLEEGDVINFERGDIIITHRIIEVLRDVAGNVSFKTKGDNNRSADDILVTPNDVRGIVTGMIPKIGLPILLLKSSDIVPEGVVDDGHKETKD